MAGVVDPTEVKRAGWPFLTLLFAPLLLALAFLASCNADSESTESTNPTSSTEASGDGEDAWSGTNLVIDTDLSKWWDDATAVGIANVLSNREEVRVLGIMSDVPNAAAVPAIDAINTAYGNPDIALGSVPGDTFEHGYTDAVTSVLPRSVEQGEDVPDAVDLYRGILAEAPDGSVTIVGLGGYTNLAGLLASPPDDVSDLSGRDLLAAKVDRLVINDGLFPGGAPPLTNQKIDPEAAKAVVEGDWPTPIHWVDGTTGVNMQVGAALCTETEPEHPMRVVYEELFDCGPPGDGNWDAPTLLHAIGDSPGMFEELGEGGAAVLNDSGGLAWAPSTDRTDDRYVHVADEAALKQQIESLILEEGAEE